MKSFDFMFYEWENNFPDRPFLRQPFGDTWEEYSWSEVGVKARKMANGLKSLDLPEKAHIGIFSKNCREWIIADIAIIMAGYISVPFFATLNGDQLQEVLELGDVKALFIGKVDNWIHTKEKITSAIPKIAFPHYKDHSLINDAYQWEDMMTQFKPIEEVHVPMMDDVWTIVFTSGTTGTPKGVVLTYNALEETKWSAEELNPPQVSYEGDNRFFSYLPLNHIAERVVVEYTAFKYGGTISFTESLATFSKNLIDTKPTTLLCCSTHFKQISICNSCKITAGTFRHCTCKSRTGGSCEKAVASRFGTGRSKSHYLWCRTFVRSFERLVWKHWLADYQWLWHDRKLCNSNCFNAE